MKVAIYPGSFDPITFGHMDIIERACGIFDKVILAVAESQSKKPLFTLEERLSMTESIYSDHPKIETVSFSRKLTVELARDHKACAIIRGLRAVADFEYEFQLAGMNNRLNKKIQTIFLMAEIENQLISSNMVKEIAELGGDVRKFAPKPAIVYLNKKFKNK
jgi:pantetheine-phosphate adenylyltransferase